MGSGTRLDVGGAQENPGSGEIAWGSWSCEPVAKPGIWSRHGDAASLFFVQARPPEACADRRPIVFALLEVLGTPFVETNYFLVPSVAGKDKTYSPAHPKAASGLNSA